MPQMPNSASHIPMSSRQSSRDPRQPHRQPGPHDSKRELPLVDSRQPPPRNNRPPCTPHVSSSVDNEPKEPKYPIVGYKISLPLISAENDVNKKYQRITGRTTCALHVEFIKWFVENTKNDKKLCEKNAHVEIVESCTLNSTKDVKKWIVDPCSPKQCCKGYEYARSLSTKYVRDELRNLVKICSSEDWD
jgi:hypothetical protein